MKRVPKIVLIVFLSLLTLVIVIALIISPIVKSYIEKHDKELIGRELTIEKLRINIFTGNLRLDDFSMKETDDSTSFVSFKSFEMKLNILPLLSNTVKIPFIKLDSCVVQVLQDKDKFNFDDIIRKFASDSTDTKTSDNNTSWNIAIDNIDIKRSEINYADVAIGSSFELENVTLNIPGVYFSNKDTNLGLDLFFKNGGEFHTKMGYNMESGNYRINAQLKDFEIAGILPYAQQFLNVDKIDGRLSLNMDITGETEHIMNVDLRGTADITQFTMVDKQSQIVAANKVSVSMDEINPEKMKIHFGKISMDGVEGLFEIYKDGKTNFDLLMKQSDSPTTAVAEPSSTPDFKIAEFDVKNSKIVFIDNTLRKPFNYEISDITLLSKDINFNQPNSLIASAVLQKSGKAKIKWSGELTSVKNQNLTIDIHNLDLKAFTPYSLSYFGNPLTKGNLTFVSQNIIKNFNLKGTNKLDIYHCEMGKKEKGIKPEYNMPLRVGLYILKDKDDKIDLDLPVSGNVNSPEFSYMKIVWKTLGNLMIKVAAAPISFIGSALGLNGDGMSEVPFDILDRDFTSEQYAKFTEISKLKEAKPELELVLKQYLDYDKAVEQYALFDLKRAFYLSQNPEKDSVQLEMIDYDAIRKMNTSSPQISALADTLLIRNGMTNDGNILSKALQLYAPQAKEQVDKSIERRNTRLKEYFLNRLSLEATVTSYPIDSMKLYRGESMYKVAIDIPESAQ